MHVNFITHRNIRRWRTYRLRERYLTSEDRERGQIHFDDRRQNIKVVIIHIEHQLKDLETATNQASEEGEFEGHENTHFGHQYIKFVA